MIFKGVSKGVSRGSVDQGSVVCRSPSRVKVPVKVSVSLTNVEAWQSEHLILETMGRGTGQYYKHFLNMLNSYLA